MTRHKSRVARIRRARRGTRKQSGGMLGFLNPLKWFNKTVPVPVAAPAAVVAAPVSSPTEPAAEKKKWWDIFSSSPIKPAPSPPQPPTQLPSPQTQPPPAVPVPQGGGRKTRHRRRSPRHHRK